MFNLKGKTDYARHDSHLNFTDTAGVLNKRPALKTRLSNQREQLFTTTLDAQFLINNRLLKSISDAEFSRLLPNLEPIQLDGGANLFEPTENPRFVYFPETAVISNFQVLADGNTAEVALVGREGVVGLTSVFGGSLQPTQWTQVGIGGKAFRIKTEILEEEFYLGGTLQKEMLRYTAGYISQLSQRISCCVHHLTESRFCCWLLMVYDRVGSEHLPLTQDQIARYLGVHRPCITHIAQQLREIGVIDYVRGNISILDRGELEKLACECYQAV